MVLDRCCCVYILPPTCCNTGFPRLPCFDCVRLVVPPYRCFCFVFNIPPAQLNTQEQTSNIIKLLFKNQSKRKTNRPPSRVSTAKLTRRETIQSIIEGILPPSPPAGPSPSSLPGARFPMKGTQVHA